MAFPQCDKEFMWRVLTYKQSRRPFKHDLPIKSHQKLEIMHSNMCGHFEMTSLKVNCDFLPSWMNLLGIYVFICWKRKSDLFTNFKRFKLQVEKHA